MIYLQVTLMRRFILKSKTTIIAVVVVLLAVAGGAYFVLSNKDEKKTVTVNSTTTNEQGEQQTEQTQVEVTKATDIASTLSAWKTAGLTVSDDKGVAYQMVDAKNGGKYDVGATNVELYEYESTAKADEMKQSPFFADSADTVFVTGTLLVVIHSNESATVEPIKAVF